jgi:putative ABC transport system permease protein
LYEALLVSLTGGIAGIIMGFFLTTIITKYAGWNTVLTPLSVFSAIIISVVVGLVFGIYPAKKAADKDPVEALRYE